jgi:nicotinate-nucleotide--dimethylbenzimidazole phosphoribosyltransferase
MFPRLQHELDRITMPDPKLADEAQARLDDLTKPKGSLGRLEELAVGLCLIQEGLPATLPARVVTIAADHGVAANQVSAYPREVTRQMVQNFLGGGAAINVLCRRCGLDHQVVDAGVLGPDFDPHPHLVRAKIAQGTADFTREPAMTGEQVRQALELGLDLAEQARQDGMRALGLGEMGIGNTTAAAALYCAYLDLDPAAAAGPGTGLDELGVVRKMRVVADALLTHNDAVHFGDPVEVLRCLGGLEIAALTGLTLGAAARRMPVMVDGFIATAAALAATRIKPETVDYCLFAHASAEPGHATALEAMDAHPLLHLEMRLGEGTGAALGLFLCSCATHLLHDMATFSKAGVSQKVEEE